MTAPRYSDRHRDVAVALAQATSQHRAADATGIDRRTIASWIADRRESHLRSVEAAQLEEALIGQVLELARRAMSHITEEKLAKASAAELTLIVSRCVDKAQLLRGQPTAIVQHDVSGLSDQELAIELQALEVEARQAGDTPLPALPHRLPQ